MSDDELLALLLDPRTRIIFNLQPIQDAEPTVFVRAARVLREALSRFPAPQPAVPVQEEAAEPPAKKRRKYFDMDIGGSDRSDEVDKFIARSETIEMDDDPLSWWRKSEPSFPNVARVARYYLAIPGASILPESTNSDAGFIVDTRRAAMVPHTVADLVYIFRTLRGRDDFTF